MDGNSVTTIINNLNTLDSNAVSQLIAYTAGVIAIVGLLVPAIIAFVQGQLPLFP